MNNFPLLFFGPLAIGLLALSVITNGGAAKAVGLLIALTAVKFLWLKQKILQVTSASLGPVCDAYAKVLHDLTWMPLDKLRTLTEKLLWEKVGEERQPFLSAASDVLGGEPPSWDPGSAGG